MTELKPCPFCGGKPEYTDDYYSNGTNYHNVFCTECGAGSAYISGFNTKNARNQVIEAWNRRALRGGKQE